MQKKIDEPQHSRTDEEDQYADHKPDELERLLEELTEEEEEEEQYADYADHIPDELERLLEEFMDAEDGDDNEEKQAEASKL